MYQFVISQPVEFKDLAREDGGFDHGWDASTLGLKPGEWPESVMFEGLVYDRKPITREFEEIGMVRYANFGRRGIVIFND